MAQTHLKDVSKKAKLKEMAEEQSSKEVKTKKKEKIPMEYITTRLPKGLSRDIKLYCVMNDISMQQFITEAIQEKLKRSVK